MLKKVLWIEDGAEQELFNMLSPIYISGKYDLSIARDATEAVEKLRTGSFSAVIVDIRLPPGRDRQWVEVYQGYRENRDAAMLGLHLLRALFAPEKTAIKVADDQKERHPPSRFGVFSVESDLEDELTSLNILNYEKKNAHTPRTKVLELIEKIAS